MAFDEHLNSILLNFFKGTFICRLHGRVHVIKKYSNDEKHQDTKPNRNTARFVLWTGTLLAGFGNWWAWPRSLIGCSSLADNGPWKWTGRGCYFPVLIQDQFEWNLSNYNNSKMKLTHGWNLRHLYNQCIEILYWGETS